MKLIISLFVALCFVTFVSTTLSRRRERAYRNGLVEGIAIGSSIPTDRRQYVNDNDVYQNRGNRFNDGNDYYSVRPSFQGPSSAGSAAGTGSSAANVVLGAGSRGTSLGARAGSEQTYGSSRTNSEAFGFN